MISGSPVDITFLFTDIEGSTRLWEEEPSRMPSALAQHDLLCRTAVEENHGTVVKMIGDGMYATFNAPADALRATVALQLALGDPAATFGIPFRVRCGLHLGTVVRRDSDFFGGAVNRAARIMGAAHGGQVLLSKEVSDRVGECLGSGVALRVYRLELQPAHATGGNAVTSSISICWRVFSGRGRIHRSGRTVLHTGRTGPADPTGRQVACGA